MKNILIITAIAVGLLGVAAQAHGQSIPVGSKVLSVYDVEKTVINRVPTSLLIC